MKIKHIVLIVVILIAALLIYNYVKSGKLSLLPTEPSADEKQLQDLEKRLGEVEKEIRQIELIASTSGVADTAGYEKYTQERDSLKEQIKALKEKLGKK